MSTSQKRTASRMKSFRVTPAEDDFLLDAAKRKGVGISTFCRDAALEAAGKKKPDEASRPGVELHIRAVGEMLAAACLVQRLLRATDIGDPAKKGIGHHDEILDACSRIIAAANDLVGDAS